MLSKGVRSTGSAAITSFGISHEDSVNKGENNLELLQVYSIGSDLIFGFEESRCCCCRDYCLFFSGLQNSSRIRQEAQK